jgi:hypothetical protein
MPGTATIPAAIVPEPAPEPAKPAPKPAPKQAANRGNGHQITEAIPRNKRADVGKTHLEKEDHTHTGNGAQALTQGRPSAPKQRN